MGWDENKANVQCFYTVPIRLCLLRKQCRVRAVDQETDPKKGRAALHLSGKWARETGPVRVTHDIQMQVGPVGPVGRCTTGRAVARRNLLSLGEACVRVETAEERSQTRRVIRNPTMWRAGCVTRYRKSFIVDI